IIGSHMMRGVSGGERKRVSIGHELLINPSMLLLDEPTSGLDSTTALRLMHTLRSLASGGRTIVTSIHQPSSRLYRQMDNVCMCERSNPRVVGNSDKAVGGQLAGSCLPPVSSDADHILDLANGDIVSRGGGASSSSCAGDAATCSSSTEASSEDEIHRQLIEAFEKRNIGETNRLSVCLGPVAAAAEAEADAAAAESKWGAPWMQQVRYLALRSVKTRRFQSLSVQKSAQLLVVAVLAGLFWWQIGTRLDSRQAALDVGGLLFFVEQFMGFSTLFAALFTFPLEFQAGMLVKERQSGMYRLSAYYIARTASDLPMDCLLPSLFVWVVYWMAGLRVDAGAFFAHWASVLLIVLTSQSVGLLIGATVINPQNGQTIATIFMLATMLVCGYYVRGIPVWIAWLKYVSYIYWGWNLLLKVEFRHRPFDCGLVAESDDGPAAMAAAAAAAAAGQRCTVGQAGIFEMNVDVSVRGGPCVIIMICAPV
ncbi:hypothetical protein VOLCADRAFT_68689, partial [Volvox carteri f. nagariensis]